MLNGRRTSLAGLALAGLLTASAGAVQIGAVTDYVLYTDIVANIDGCPIPSYNVAGDTVVVAEDLIDYGFTVEWLPAERRLEVTRTEGKAYTADYVPQENTHPIGSRAMPVLSTDIVTTLDGVSIPSRNIDGRTVIAMDDLAERYAASYRWDRESRTLSLTTDWRRDLSAPERVDQLQRGFAVKANGFTRENAEVRKTGSGDWGGVDGLTITAEGVSFSLYQRVLSRYDGCLNGLNADAAVFDPVRDNLPENRQENTPERWNLLQTYLRVYVNGEQKTGTLWLGKGNGHTDYTFRFDEPLDLDQVEEVYVTAGDAAWVAEQTQSYLGANT